MLFLSLLKIFSLSSTTEFATIADTSREGYRTNPLVRLRIAILDIEKPDLILIEHNLTWANLIRLDLIYVNLEYSLEYILTLETKFNYHSNSWLELNEVRECNV